MSGGLAALLDDIATLAKAAAASVDDIAAGAAKTSSKAVGVVIDDTAVTPQYVHGLSPARELPIIAKIARGSLINKLLFILPVSLLLTWLAPWTLPVLLIIGGSYLCFEGAEKILSKAHLLPHSEGYAENKGAQTAEELEKQVVSSAIRTDLILSAEIMLISLAGLTNESSTMRLAIMVTVALSMTFLVYGLVAVLVKLDDLGTHLVEQGGPLADLGRGIVRTMPRVFDAIGIIGTLAMLWVGGHILISSLAELHVEFFHHLVESAVAAAAHLGGAVKWLIETLLSGIFGLLWGGLLAYLWVGVQHLRRRQNQVPAST